MKVSLWSHRRTSIVPLPSSFSGGGNQHNGVVHQPASCFRPQGMASSQPHRSAGTFSIQWVLPNPSLKRSHNGIAVWPSIAGAAPHFALAVQSAMPLRAA